MAEARQKAAQADRLLFEGKDPIRTKREARAALAKTISFNEAAKALFTALRPGWRSAAHAGQWQQSIANLAAPIISDMNVADIATSDIMRVLDPLWPAKPETASRLRGRIEAILDWARVRGYRTGENPARWKGHLDHLLPARAKVRRVEHHPALPYAEIAAFMAELRKRDGVSARALEFCVLTATRTGETLGARWNEVDREKRLWTIPASRMKAGREHRVPLSDPALEILEKMATDRGDSDFVFSARRGRPLARIALLNALHRMGRSDLTTHGFRSAFRDWAGNETAFAREIAEQALAHVTGDATERAYRRSDALARRRELMDAWAWHCEGVDGANVLAFKQPA